MVLVDATAPPRKFTNCALIWARFVPVNPDTALLLLLCSSFTQVVILPHTWFAHWLALRLAWVDDEPDPLELEPPPQAAKARPMASVTATTPPGLLPAIGPSPLASIGPLRMVEAGTDRRHLID